MKKLGFMLFIPLLFLTALPAKDTDGGTKSSITRQKLAVLAADAAIMDAAGSLQLRQRPFSREKTAYYPFLGGRWTNPEIDVSLRSTLAQAGEIPVSITDVNGALISEYEVGDTIVITISYADSVWIKPYVDNGDDSFDPETDFYFAPGDPEDDEEEIIIIDGDEDDETPAGDDEWKLTFYTGKAGEEDMLFILQGVKIFFSLSNRPVTDTGLYTLDVLPPVSTTSLSGNVTKFDETAAPNVVIVAFPMPTMEMEGPPESMFITLTDATGDYTLFIEDEAADVDFGLFAFDLLRQCADLFPDPQMVMQPVAKGDSLTNLDFVFIEPTAVIRGTLTDELDSPIADVCIFAGLDGPLEAEATTDATGKYEISVISGRWRVRPEEEDLIGMGYMAPHEKEDFDISDGDTVVVNFVAYIADATITGNVTKDGTALPGLEIGAWGEPVGYTFTESGTDGSYTLNVSNEVDVRGYDVWPEDPPEQTSFADKLRGIQPGDTDVDINLVTVTGGIAGVVTDEATGDTLYEDIGIMVRDITGAEFDTWIDRETGKYLIYLPDGVYELMAFSHEYLPYQSGPIPVAGSVVEHNIALKELVFNAKIGGTLKDTTTNSPIAGVRIFAGAEDMFGMDDTTDAAGQYGFDVFAGWWHVHLFDEDLIDQGYMVPYGKDGYEVAAGDSIPVDFVTYVADTTITGTVTWVGDGSAVEYAEIQGDTRAGYFSRTRTGSDGTYSLPVSSELDSIDITDEYGTWKTNGYCIHVETKDAFAQPGDSCEVYSGATGVDFTMYHADAFLSGQISDQWGNPISHVGLHAFTIESTMEFHTGGGTEFGGFYEMPLVGGYTWVVEVFLPQFHDSTALTDTLVVASDTSLVRDYTFTLLSTIVTMDGGNLPGDYALGDNYPNPFNPSTTITFQLPEAGYVTMQVYDLTGKVVNTLVGEYRPAGYHQVVWNGKNSRGAPVATGVYFYRIVVGQSYAETRKMVLIK